VKYWAALSDELRPNASWSKGQAHCFRWLRCSPQRLAATASGRAPENSGIALSRQEVVAVVRSLRRQISRKRGKLPRVKMARSMALEEDMYRVFVEAGKQFIAIAGAQKGKRAVIPLKGNTRVSGNIRVVVGREHVEVHVSYEVQPPVDMAGPVIGVDGGITEHFTDSTGKHYGESLGNALKERAARLTAKMRGRGRLHATQKKHLRSKNVRKARNIRRCNLGRKHLRGETDRFKADYTSTLNRSINSLIRHHRPSVIVTEKLDMRGPSPSRDLSRKVALWMRGTLTERFQFKASAEGFRHVQVNPAYTSQTCPQCGNVHQKNRTGDVFQCSACGHLDDADRVGAHNCTLRIDDPEITVETPHRRVRSILVQRHRVRLEGVTHCSGTDPSLGCAERRAKSWNANSLSEGDEVCA
jgi:putative transposase